MCLANCSSAATYGIQEVDMRPNLTQALLTVERCGSVALQGTVPGLVGNGFPSFSHRHHPHEPTSLPSASYTTPSHLPRSLSTPRQGLMNSLAVSPAARQATSSAQVAAMITGGRRRQRRFLDVIAIRA